MIYAVEIENSTKSDDPRMSSGMSDTIWPYTIHSDDDTIFRIENVNEYGFVDFLVYNKYIKINRPDIEMAIAEYAMIKSVSMIKAQSPDTIHPQEAVHCTDMETQVFLSVYAALLYSCSNV